MQTDGENGLGKVSELEQFLQLLASEGQAAVSPDPLPPDEAGASAVLVQMDATARAESALDLPPLDLPAALWAARHFYHLCQFTLCRDLGPELMQVAFSQPAPEPRTPATDWAADLTFRHLPRLFQLAHHLSSNDPLLEEMKRTACAWPLSSVGTPGLGPLPPGDFLAHPALARMYADRITVENDFARLGDERVDNRLRADLGLHPELAPALAAKLFPTTP